MSYFRSPKTANEKRKSYACNSKYVRKRRQANKLADAWDDTCRALQKSWKWQTKRKKQHGYNQVKIRRLTHYYNIEE